MTLRTTGSVFVVFLCSAGVVLGQNEWRVTYNQPSVCMLRRSSVDLSCSYSYPSGLTVTKTFWFTKSDTEDLSVDPEYAGCVEYRGDKKSDCTLRITDLRFRDAAEYKFRIITDQSGGRDYGRPGITLSVTDLQVKVSPSTRVGQRVTLTCSSTCTLTGNPSYIWYKNGQRVQQVTFQHHSVTRNSDDSYSCAVEGHEDLRSPAVCVSGQSCSRVTYSSRRVCVLKGSSVDISCTYYSYHIVISSLWFSPEKRDRWRDRSTPEDLAGDPEYAGRVQYPGTGSISSTLRIRDLRESDSAEYRFMYKTDSSYYNWGDSFPGTTLTVTDLQVEVSPSTREGQRVTLTCSSTCTLTGNPSYIWYKNGEPVQNAKSKIHIVGRNSYDTYSCAVEGHEDLRSPAVYSVVAVSRNPVVVVMVVVLAAGALLVLLCRTLKRRSTTGSDATRGAQIPFSPQRVQSDPSCDTYTALILRNRSTDYDTLASVSDTYTALQRETCSSDYETMQQSKSPQSLQD